MSDELGAGFLGVLIVTVGTLLPLDNLDYLDSGDIIGTWWPVAIIFGALLSYLANRRHVVCPWSWLAQFSSVGSDALH